jgi:hypothetical protein
MRRKNNNIAIIVPVAMIFVFLFLFIGLVVISHFSPPEFNYGVDCNDDGSYEEIVETHNFDSGDAYEECIAELEYGDLQSLNTSKISYELINKGESQN